ncbi:ComEC/Rec2 family competence protein [Lachnospiraceae bacterium 48-21]
MAISGLHLSFIGVGMYKILRRITGAYPVGGVFGILFLMFYILMIECTVSAVRGTVISGNDRKPVYDVACSCICIIVLDMQ